MTDQIISQEGYDKLVNELSLLTTVKRREIADRIQRAKDMGDLSENAEYSEAKDAQAFNEGRIAEVTQMIKNLTVVQNGNNKDYVGMGSNVTVEANGMRKEYTIVSFNESDPINGKISNESPLGRAFLGKRKNDTALVKTPKGEMEYRIINVN
jgi:transcription elongation factor GreA